MSKKPTEKVIVSATGRAEGKSTVHGVGKAIMRPPDNHPVLNLIGRVAAEWANLEHILDRTIWKLAKVPGSRGACMTAQMMGVWARFNTIDALLTQRSGKLPAMQNFIKPMRSFAQDCRNASDKRNRIVHDPWYVDGSGAIARFVSMPKGELVYGLKDEDRERILTTIKKIKVLAKRAEKFRLEIYAQLDA